MIGSKFAVSETKIKQIFSSAQILILAYLRLSHCVRFFCHSRTQFCIE